MAESTGNSSRSSNVEEEDDDYMGDLSMFIPPEASASPKPYSKKVSNNIGMAVHPAKKKSKTQNWQEQRKLNRVQKQIQEDEQTIASMNAPIPQSNIGFKLLKQMGYTPGSALGKEGSGKAEPVGLEIRRSRAGIGRDDPHKEKKKREERAEMEAERKKQKVEELIVEFGSRQKSQWRSKRVAINYKKAQASLDQLENKEVVVPKKEGDEEGEQEEEEEEQITEEDLEDILMKLRDEHQYCLFCGCKYESMDALLSNCPGIDEDDH